MMLRRILDVLVEAVTRGAVEVLTLKRTGTVGVRYKDAKELVTAADERSDAAIRSVFETQLLAIDPTISLHLEESGATGASHLKKAGADPLDGTNHFASGGNLYSVMAHYVEDGVPRIGVVFQPEVYLPLEESETCIGRIVYAICGEGAFVERTGFTGDTFIRHEPRPVKKRTVPEPKTWVACVPFSTKMAPEEWEQAKRVYESGIISVSTGVGGAGGNVMMTIFGGQHVYANFGAGEDLDLIPTQVIAEEAGMTVWGSDRRPPIWQVRKQPFIVAPSPEIAERFLRAAGL